MIKKVKKWTKQEDVTLKNIFKSQLKIDLNDIQSNFGSKSLNDCPLASKNVLTDLFFRRKLLLMWVIFKALKRLPASKVETKGKCVFIFYLREDCEFRKFNLDYSWRILYFYCIVIAE